VVPARHVVRFKPGKRLREGAVSSAVGLHWRGLGLGMEVGARCLGATPPA
jgi:hypothetical protein